MATRIWRGDAPAVAQVDEIRLTSDVYEGTELLFTINGKTVLVMLPEDAETDTDTDLLEMAADVLSDSTIPEFQEITWEYELELNGRGVLRATGTPGVPFTLTVTSPYPQVDVDTVADGGPGVDAVFSYTITNATNGSYFLKWDLGSGEEVSNTINLGATPEQVRTAIVNGMASVADGDISVAGSSNSFTITCKGNLAETALDAPTLDTTNLADGAGAATVVVIRSGAASTTDAVYYVATSTPASTADIWVQLYTPLVTQQIIIHTAFTKATLEDYLETIVGIGNVEVFGFGGTAREFVIRFKGDLSGVDCRITGLTSNAFCKRIQFGGVGHQDDGQCEIYVLELGGAVNGETFTLTSDGHTTGAIEFGTAGTAADIQIEIGELTHISGAGAGGTTYSRYPPASQKLFVFRISGGDYSGTDVPDFTADFSSLTGTTSDNKITKLFDGGTTGVNELVAVYTNGTGGFLTLALGAQTTAPFSPLISANDLTDLFTDLSTVGAGNCTITGSGTASDPWLFDFGSGSLAGTDVGAITADATLLGTGLAAGEVETLVEGAAVTNESYTVTYHGVTGGTVAYSFRDERTIDLAWNHSAGDLEDALEDLPSIGAGNVTVSGSGPFTVSMSGSMFDAEDLPQLVAHNEDLTGASPVVTIDKETTVDPTGPNWYDDPSNWRNASDNSIGLPATNDDVVLETGDEANSIYYGLTSQSSVKLNSFRKDSRFTGFIGLPDLNPLGYTEYRDTTLVIGLASDGDQTVLIGRGQGSGSGRVRLSVGADEAHFRVERTAGAEDDGYQACQLDGSNASNTLEIISGGVAGAQTARDVFTVSKLTIRGGSFYGGPNCTIGDLDKTEGDVFLDECTINGTVNITG